MNAAQIAERIATIQTAEHADCHRCFGKGIIGGFRHVYGGTCFACGGGRCEPGCKPCKAIRELGTIAHAAGHAFGASHPERNDAAFNAAFSAFKADIGWTAETYKALWMTEFKAGTKEGRAA